MARIFAVEDDQSVLSGLKKLLEGEHHAVETCSDGAEAARHLEKSAYDLIILDWELPGMHGVDICKSYRHAGGRAPVLMLTGKNTVEDKSRGFDSGADDYLTKPFDPRELGMRVKALLRRIPEMGATVLQAGQLKLDLAAKQATLNNVPVELPPDGLLLLECLLRHPNHSFSTQDLLERVWPGRTDATPEELRTLVKRLRKKVDPVGEVIETVQGLGYILRAYDVEAAPVRPRALGQGNEGVLAAANLSQTSLASKYEFLEVIGEGGVAIVLKAQHPHLQKTVAVKMLKCSDSVEELESRFEREARVVANLEHPNIITVHDFGITENHQPYMVMEYIDGQDCAATLLEHPDGLALEQALPILIAVSAGFEYAHERGVFHRDIKPGNIVLKPTDTGIVPKIVDFGIAKMTGWTTKNEAALTQDQQLIGSPAYMCPELLMGKKTDARSDIYSFGCVIFELVTGYTPFIGETAIEVATKRLRQAPLSFADVQPSKSYPPQLERIVIKALQVEVEDRYQTMKEVHDDLVAIDVRADDNSLWSQLKKFKPFQR